MTSRIPPPIIVVIAAVLIWTAARYTAPAILFPGQALLALLLAVIGLVMTLLGVTGLRRTATTMNPLRAEKATTLVTRGIYRVSRNPMYLGLAIVLLAWAIYLATWLGVIVVALYVAYMDYFQIRPEERALASQFGRTFAAYRQAVRRWL